MSAVPCTKCGRELDERMFNQPDWLDCPNCEAPLRVEVFPALFQRAAPAQSGQALVTEGEASCFYHPHKKAVLPCDACGRFLCGLCDVDFNGEHLCPACLETGRKKGRLSNLDNRRTLYDSLALSLVLLPMVLLFVWPLSLVTAPAALFVAVRYWKAPGSLTRQSKIRFVVAILLALIQIVAWGILFWWWFNR
jgi:hypothetical protein